ncbi:ATP-dependent RNA helicase HrpA [Fuerstiella marisgermanici]|uniref:ATP-dependent RNA helicase HrpB n=1 Tax=Fuerstiella marisgermanici TaxID=1891926 RepID=A0A1P8WD78_9PLAN|nr:ATP-dependent RNA helicase HrpA [Fuerstiella marisgermanici]APZ92002.1 ATP-dependent RNA helicase HrpB [Fuerstiella marisgermanici]
MEFDAKALQTQISTAMRADQFSLRRLLRSITNAKNAGKPFDRNLKRLNDQLQRSTQRFAARSASVPKIDWPEDLPVVARRDEIADAIRQHQVVVVCGETGSGKSTQLPKIALELGRGIGGVIGHTQPRRIAARSIATRLAEELKCEVGKQVGYRIRFNDASGPNTLIRLMTDGVMLAETQSDRFLDQYDTIIVDEAHERSLNIDFLLGYLKRLLPKRKDLRLIITSATIDAERFAEHFGQDGTPAPVVVVEGRTYPVDIRYRPLDQNNADEEGGSQDRDWRDGIVDAIDEVAANDSGHLLVFLPTERDIREADKLLNGRKYSGDTSKHPTQVVPLYGRLSMADQTKVFQPYQHRRIVLATNVAESSLTVPGIRYVIDTGTARISRYSARSRMQRLPIEAVSQASANQRAGRCGRVGPGICIRLYDEEDFNGREAFTAPEIQRTNLAAVILRTMNLKLGRLDEFPFLDPPRPTTVREGYKTLEELGAITGRGTDDYVLTEIGRHMARLPVDPRISRMVLAAIEEHAAPEVMIIAAALETQDPRERPIEKQQAADEAHAQFKNAESDFLTLLAIWDTWHERKKKLSGSQLRKWCKQNFLSWMRMREWIDVHRQLRDLLKESGDKQLEKAAVLNPFKDRKNDYAAIHRSLMTGLLANLAFKSADREYTGAGGNKLQVWPGSGLARKPPKWFVAAELVETSQRFARTLATIQPEWIEPLADHLVKREHSEPHWDSKAGNVMCFEKVSLWGLPIVPRRKTSFAKVDAAKSRELLIQFGLVELALLYGKTEEERDSEFAEEERTLLSGSRSRLTPGRSTLPNPSSSAFRSGPVKPKTGWGRDFPFLSHNVGVLEQVKELQARTRQHDLLPTEDALFEFYDKQIPHDVADRNRLRQWYRRTVKSQPALLQFDINTFTSESERQEGSAEFPPSMKMGTMDLPLSYQLDPGRNADGVTVTVPCEGLAQLDQNRLTWLVPGLLSQKVTELIRSLPKDLRRKFVPAPDTAREVLEKLQFAKGNLLSAVATQLTRIAGEPVRPEDFALSNLPDHLRANIRLIDNNKAVVAESRDPDQLRATLQTKTNNAFQKSQPSPEELQWQRKGFKAWDFADIPVSISITRAGMKMKSFPAIRDDGESVGLTLCQSAVEAQAVLRKGLRRMFLLTDRERIQRQVKHLPELQKIQSMAKCIPGLDVVLQLQLLMVERAYLSPTDLPRTKAQFDDFVVQGRKRLGVVVQEFVQLIPALFRQHQVTTRILADAMGSGWDHLVHQMERQLAELFHSKFLQDTPWPWLIQFTRYMTGIRMRLDRLNSGGIRNEDLRLREFAPYADRFLIRRAEMQKQQRNDPMLDHYGWMLEEFRLTVFAQKLGTAIKVSGKLLDEQWERVG